eukprot:gene19379-21302_t
MTQNFRQKDAYEQRARGINPENDEINQALAEIADRMAEFEKLWSEEKEQANEKAKLEACQAEDVRRKTAERLGQTMDRLDKKENRKRRSSTEALEIVNESLKVKKQHYVVSPLGSLMVEQMNRLKKLGISAEFIGELQTDHIAKQNVLDGNLQKQKKQKKTNRGQAWTTIANNLNSSASPKFKVTQRSVRKKLEKMTQNFRQKDAYEQRARGINPENDEINQALAEIADRMAEFEKLWSEEKEQANEKAELVASEAEEVRRKTTERLGQTMDRLDQKENRKPTSATASYGSSATTQNADDYEYDGTD